MNATNACPTTFSNVCQNNNTSNTSNTRKKGNAAANAARRTSKSKLARTERAQNYAQQLMSEGWEREAAISRARAAYGLEREKYAPKLKISKQWSRNQLEEIATSRGAGNHGSNDSDYNAGLTKQECSRKPMNKQNSTLRQYQSDAINNIDTLIEQGKRRPLLVSPTGSGKTVTAAEIVRRAVNNQTRVLFVAHRKEIIDQTRLKLDSHGIDYGIIMANHPRRRENAPVQIASIQTLANRLMPEAGLLIIDEAHHARAGIFENVLRHYSKSIVIGLTATPWRTDNKGLGEIFDSIVVAATPADLIAQGHLVQYGGFSFERPDLDNLKTEHGADYNESQLEVVCNQTKIVGGIVEAWKARAGGVRTVAFAVSVAHSKNIVSMFRAAGINAEHLDGSVPKTQREAILKKLDTGEIRVLSNVGVLTEGWDCPSAACCILARPTKSLTLYLQMVGRVLRPHPEKTRALIHDHAGCMLTHGLPDDQRKYSLDAESNDYREYTSGMSAIQCRKCFRMFPRSEVSCPECGWVSKNNVRIENPRTIQEIDGAIIAIEEIKRLRNVSVEVKAAEYNRLLSIETNKRFPRGWAANQYKAMFGTYPRIDYEILNTTSPAVKPTIDLVRLRMLQRVSGEVA